MKEILKQEFLYRVEEARFTQEQDRLYNSMSKLEERKEQNTISFENSEIIDFENEI